MQVEFDGTFEGWRDAARRLLAGRVPPERVVWQSAGAAPAQSTLDGLDYPPQQRPSPPDDPRVSRRFLLLARMVSCHRDPGRWASLYRVLWRHASGEPQILTLVTDPEVYPLLLMARSVRRAAHKMKAFVRFREVREQADGEPAYVAWFEPAHMVLEATAPFFVRRFHSMRWSILTPDRCAHWDRARLRFTPGADRAAAPSDDQLEELWRTYYAHIFNPARLNRRAMRAEMPRRYWANLPEAALIEGLARGAPRRVADMLARSHGPPEPLPEECRPTAPLPGLLEPGWHPRHDPGLAAARARAERLGAPAPEGLRTPSGKTILIGVAGWTDPTLTRGNVFYPPGAESAEGRLRYYSSRMPLVEVDSTYYSLPTRAMAVEWAARTPAHFVFDIKAHGLMTGHGADVRRLPDWLRRALPRAGTGGRLYGKDLPDELRAEVWRRFLEALEPLRAEGKLGAVLLQFPRWFTPSKASARFLADARSRLGADLGAVEFRHRSWMTERLAARTLKLLEDLELAHVVVDGPQGMESSMPRTVAATSPRLAVVRLHGRRADTWERRNDPATERYRYLYGDDEIEEHLRAVLELSELKESAVHIIYNNCHGNYAVTNAAELSWRLLRSGGPGHP
ncbi:MAG TPA: TIGR03915 family putative DNA repair protein [Gemmatimonadales bacterium]|nr:TIGR03915 family putative DNA repair protein [Gemmatimonadales bacterium]